ncbi:hypothetical protein V6N11_013097 [Hibiscus sabdariffa]|uniref:Uncharacterized protein n=1 Tax=Hibiscus sabdariffa TaxID=183260 RepID=A0ABR1ZUC0_9ROSI
MRKKINIHISRFWRTEKANQERCRIKSDIQVATPSFLTSSIVGSNHHPLLTTFETRFTVYKIQICYLQGPISQFQDLIPPSKRETVFGTHLGRASVFKGTFLLGEVVHLSQLETAISLET